MDYTTQSQTRQDLCSLPKEWLVVPVKDKRPIGGPDWPSKAVQAGSVGEHANECDWGLVLGPRSGVVDVECDGPGAEGRYAELLGDAPPVCPTWQSQRGKHRLFQWHPALSGLGCNVDLGDGLEARIGHDRAQSVLPPAGGRRWLVHPSDCDVPPLPDGLLNAILATSSHSVTPPPGEAVAGGNDANSPWFGDCLRHCQWIAIPDRNDGTRRLYAYACRAVEYDLTDSAAIALVRDLERERPFPQGWSDADIVRRIRDAEKHVERGAMIRGSEVAEALLASRNAPSRPVYHPFPVEALPPVAREFTESAASAIGCDPAFVALPLLSAMASAIGNTRRLELKQSWRVPAIVWTAVVAESGTAKTPAMHVALKPIQERQQKLLEQHKMETQEYHSSLLLHDKALTAWKRAKSDDSLPPARPEEPVAMRLVVADVTTEALAPLLLQNPRGVLLARDEVSAWVGSFDRYSNGKADAPHWLSIFNGVPIIVDRKTGTPRTISVPAPNVSVTGGIQPGVLRRLMTTEYLESGLWARVLLAYPPRRVKRWTDADVAPKLERDLGELYARLYALDFEAIDGGTPRPVVLKLTPGAKERWIEYYNTHARECARASGPMASAMAKLEEYAARLALVIHCAHGKRFEPVDTASMDCGIRLAQWFRREIQRVYIAMQESDAEREDRELADWLEQHGGEITARDLQRTSDRYREPGSAEAALDRLARKGWGVWTQSPPGQRGRPTRHFRLTARLSPDENSKNLEENHIFVGDGDVATLKIPPGGIHFSGPSTPPAGSLVEV